MQLAIEDCRLKKKSFKEASRFYQVPYSTLRDKVHGNHSKATGRPYLVPECIEDDLALLVRNYCAKGNVLEQTFFCQIAREHVQRMEPGLTFQAHSDWLKDFLKRYNLKCFDDGSSKSLGVHRILSCEPSRVEGFITVLKTAYQNYLRDLAKAMNTQVPDLTEEEIRRGIYAIDETAISNGTPLKYEPKKLVDADVFCMNVLVTGRSKVTASLMEVYAASGEMPFHVLTTKSKLSDAQKLHLSGIDSRSKLLFCELESGHFDAFSHAKVLERIGEIRQGLPSLVIQDCPSTHKSDEALDSAKRGKIHLICLPHNSSCYLQVPDELPFASMKSKHYAKVKEGKQHHNNLQPDLMRTLDIFLHARREVLTIHLIRKAFENCGQFPVSERAIRAKADRARRRCGTEKPLKETDELSLESLNQSTLDEVLDTIDRAEKQLSIMTNARRRLSGEIIATTQRLESLREQHRKKSDQAYDARRSVAQTSVQTQASLPLAQDPSLYLTSQTFDGSLFPPSIQNKDFLTEQLKVMKILIKRLEEESAQQLDATFSSYMLDPNVISPRERLRARLTWVKSVKSHVKFINDELKRHAELLKSCLNQDCASKKSRQRWQVCSICKRGYCPSCVSRFSLQEHSTQEHPQVSTTTSVTTTSNRTTTIIRIPRSSMETATRSVLPTKQFLAVHNANV